MARNNKTLYHYQEEHPVETDGTLPKIKALLNKFGQQICDDDFRMTVADYVRLLQVQRDLEDTEPKDIEVSWVDNLEETNEPGI